VARRGRTDFLTEARRYEDLLREPDVGLALDPEWRLGPDQRHLEQVGTVDASEVNEVSAWLAGIVRDYVNGLDVDEHAPEDVLFEVGTMQLRLSDLYGGVGLANFGETGPSGELLDEAERSLRLALEKSPDNAGALAELVMVKRMQTMQSLYYKLDLDLAFEQNAEAFALAERGLALPDADEAPFLRHLWSVRTDLVQLLNETERYEEVVENLAAWRAELTPEMYERLGGGQEMGAYMASQHAETLNELGRPQEALDAIAETIAFREAELEKMPESYYQQQQLMTAAAEQSKAWRMLGNAEESLAAADRAVDLARRIMAADPEDAGGPEGMTVMLMRKARAHEMSGDLTAAITASDESVEHAVFLDGKFPGDLFYQKLLYQSLALNARLLADSSRRDAACARLEEAEALFTLMEPEDGDSVLQPSAAEKDDIRIAAETAQCAG